MPPVRRHHANVHVIQTALQQRVAGSGRQTLARLRCRPTGQPRVAARSRPTRQHVAPVRMSGRGMICQRLHEMRRNELLIISREFLPYVCERLACRGSVEAARL